MCKIIIKDYQNLSRIVDEALMAGGFIVFKKKLYKKMIGSLLTFISCGEGFEFFIDCLNSQKLKNSNFLVFGNLSLLKKMFEHSFFDTEITYNYIELNDCVWGLKEYRFYAKSDLKSLLCFKFFPLLKKDFLKRLLHHTLTFFFGKRSKVCLNLTFFKKFFFLEEMARCVGQVVSNTSQDSLHLFIFKKETCTIFKFLRFFFIWMFGLDNIAVLESSNFDLKTIASKKILFIKDFIYKRDERLISDCLYDRTCFILSKRFEVGYDLGSSGIYLHQGSSFSPQVDVFNLEAVGSFYENGLSTVESIPESWEVFAEFPLFLERCV